MHAKFLNMKVKAAILAVAGLVATGVASAQTVVNLTAQRSVTTLPDGKIVPMWGFCTTGSCTNAWSVGPTITATPGSSLTINLTNNLPTPTSVVILGQIGGGLGSPIKTASPAHPGQSMTTWPTNAAFDLHASCTGSACQIVRSRSSGEGWNAVLHLVLAEPRHLPV